MANDYYTPSGYPVQNEAGDSASGRAEFAAIGAGMAKIAPITGNGGKVVRINAGATQQEAVDPGLVIDALPAKTTPVGADEIPLSDSAASLAGKKLTWTNLQATLLAYFNGIYLALTGGTVTGAINMSAAAVNEAITTVASATTPNIWTSAGNIINYTGTATATGFAAAPQAGSRRILDCAAAAVFTAGANMLIDGVASGSNLTVAAGDRVEVYARTTTQFVLRHIAFATTSTDPTYASTNDAVIPSVSWVRNAMSAIATAAGFASSFGGNGYIKFPSWLGAWIVQWGAVITNAGNTDTTFTYPLTFTTAAYAAWVSVNRAGTTDYASITSAIGVSSLTIRCSNANTGTNNFVLVVGK